MIKLLFSCILCLLLTSCGKTGCSKAYFQSVSSITLPEGTSRIDCYDNLEWRVEVLFQLPETNLDAFLVANKFEKIETSSRADNFSFFFLAEEHRHFPDESDLYLATSSNANRTYWLSILDKNTGKLWTIINYPDWGGT